MAFGGAGDSFQRALAGRRAGGFWPKKCFILFHFVPFPIWGLGRLGTDLGGFDTRMGINGTHLGRNGTLRWALAATVRRGCLPGRGAAHGEIIARACASGQAEVGHVGRVAVREPQSFRQVRRVSSSVCYYVQAQEPLGTWHGLGAKTSQQALKDRRRACGIRVPWYLQWRCWTVVGHRVGFWGVAMSSELPGEFRIMPRPAG